MNSNIKNKAFFVLGVLICFALAALSMLLEGLKPMFYGITIDTLVTLTALSVIWCMGLM